MCERFTKDSSQPRRAGRLNEPEKTVKGVKAGGRPFSRGIGRGASGEGEGSLQWGGEGAGVWGVPGRLSSCVPGLPQAAALRQGLWLSSQQKQRRKAWPSRSRTIKSHNFKGGIDVTAESPESGEIAVVRAWPRPSGRLGVGLTEVPWAQTWALSSELEFALLAIFSAQLRIYVVAIQG